RGAADDRNERPEDLLEPRLEIARPGAYVSARVPEVPQPVGEELVPDLPRLRLEAAVEIERYPAPDRAAAHVLSHAAALQRPVLKEAAGRHDLRAEDAVRTRIELLLRRDIRAQNREALRVSVVQDLHDLAFLI